MDVDSLTDTALQKLWNDGFDALTQREQLSVIIWGVEADVNNGGFDQYYFNSYGDQANICPSALRLIGANRMAELVDLANSAFGPDGPQENREMRQMQLEKIRDVAESVWEPLQQEFWEYPDDVTGLLKLHLEGPGGAV